MSTPSNRLSSVRLSNTPETDPEVEQEMSVDSETDDNGETAISDAEADALRQQRLATIRKAVEAGLYDSDELLEKAMKRMRAAIENEDD